MRSSILLPDSKMAAMRSGKALLASASNRTGNCRWSEFPSFRRTSSFARFPSAQNESPTRARRASKEYHLKVMDRSNLVRRKRGAEQRDRRRRSGAEAHTCAIQHVSLVLASGYLGPSATRRQSSCRRFRSAQISVRRYYLIRFYLNKRFSEALLTPLWHPTLPMNGAKFGWKRRRRRAKGRTHE